MKKKRESLISAYHNYLVNNMLTPGFILGDPRSPDAFYFLADFVPPEKNVGCISARIFDRKGTFLVEIQQNIIGENPGRCSFRSTPDGFRILHESGKLLLEVSTKKFTNGYLTRIQGKLYDKNKRLRMEPSYGNILVHGDMSLTLDAPFEWSVQ